MSNSRAVVPLDDVLDFREGPGIMAYDFHDEGVPLIRLAGLKDGAALLTGCNYLSPAKVDAKWSQFRVHPGDVLLSTSASLGEVAVVDEAADGAIPYTGIIRFRPRDDRVCREFLPYALVSPSFQRQIEAMGVGSVMRHFGPFHLRQMTLELPPLAEQRAIAEVLGALDDKIEANRKLTSLCDALWRAIGTRTVDMTEAGEGADGDFQPLSAIAKFINGKAFTKNATGTGRMVVRIAELNSGPGASTIYNDIDVAPDHLARPGDLLFAWSGSLTVQRWFRSEAIINQHIFKVVPEPGTPMWFVHAHLLRLLPDFQQIAAGKATTMGHIQRHNLDVAVAMPHWDLLGQMDVVCGSLWRCALEAEIETLALARLRAALLPKMMSGEVRVSNDDINTFSEVGSSRKEL